MAARTVYDALDAATASAPATQSHAKSAQKVAVQRPAASQSAARAAVHQTLQTASRVQGTARAARQGMLAPVKRASRAVSLEIAGSFFALFALSFGAAAWRFRGAYAAVSEQRLWIYVGLAALFGYFALSSFLRARQISRAA